MSRLKSTPSNLSKNESLNHTVNFGVGSVFSKGPGSVFFQGPGLGLGPLYKVCPFFRQNVSKDYGWKGRKSFVRNWEKLRKTPKTNGK